jgi:hypothetical protein
VRNAYSLTKVCSVLLPCSGFLQNKGRVFSSGLDGEIMGRASQPVLVPSKAGAPHTPTARATKFGSHLPRFYRERATSLFIWWWLQYSLSPRVSTIPILLTYLAPNHATIGAWCQKERSVSDSAQSRLPVRLPLAWTPNSKAALPCYSSKVFDLQFGQRISLLACPCQYALLQ